MSKEIAFFPRLVKGLIKHNAEYLFTACSGFRKSFKKLFTVTNASAEKETSPGVLDGIGYM